jgi:hypothetical protein
VVETRDLGCQKHWVTRQFVHGRRAKFESAVAPRTRRDEGSPRVGHHFIPYVLGGMFLEIGLGELCYACLLREFQEGNDVAYMIVLMSSRCKS